MEEWFIYTSKTQTRQHQRQNLAWKYQILMCLSRLQAVYRVLWLENGGWQSMEEVMISTDTGDEISTEIVYA